MSTTTRANCFDASALLKLYVQENGSDELRTYWNSEPTKFTTSLCFYEALTLLKVCHFYRKILDVEAYKRATLDLCAWYGAVSESIPELKFLSPEVFFAAQRTAENHKIDLSDAFQIHTVREGFFPNLSADSRTILVSADRDLVKAARAEGLRVWSILDELPNY
jgi:predicted nucleic acid-binding protein